MTTETKAPRCGAALALVRESLPDAVGILGFGLLTRGLWVGLGEAVALAVCGAMLMGLSVYSAIRGGG